ncbi:MAG: DUF4126 family protein [bacterium]|nr:DUF4126 family protein [bacterium]
MTLANPVLSVGEDAVAITALVLAVTLPVLGALAALALLVVIAAALRRARSRSSNRA